MIAPKATLQSKCDERAEGKGFAIKIYDDGLQVCDWEESLHFDRGIESASWLRCEYERR